MATGARKRAAVAADANLVRKAQARKVQKSLWRRDTKAVSHAEPVIVLAVAPADTESGNQAIPTPHCQFVTLDPPKRPEATVVYSA